MSLLAHRVDGEGEAIVLLNGGMMTIGSWDVIAASLARIGRVIRCDFRGQSLSPGPPFNMRLAEHVADVVALLDDLQIERAHVIGTSFGGEVATLIAATHPTRVRSLVVATALDYGVPEFEDGVRALRRACDLAVNGTDRFAMYDLLTADAYSEDYQARNAAILAARRAHVAALPNVWFEGTASIMDALIGLDLRPLLPRISCPTMVVIAEHDAIMPLERSRGLVAGIPGAAEAFVAGSGHALVVENPAEFNRICVDFLARHLSCTPQEPKRALGDRDS